MKTIQKDIQESLVHDFQEIAKRAVEGIPVQMLRGIRVTESGRPVALSFREQGDGKRTTNIYMDDLLTIATGESRRLHVVGQVHAFIDPTEYEKRRPGRRAKKKEDHENPAACIVVQREKPKIPGSIKRFTLHFINNIRKLVCGRNGSKPSLGHSSTAIVAGLGTWIATEFGINNHVGFAMASGVMVLLVAAGKGAFCDMATAEIEEAIRRF